MKRVKWGRPKDEHVDSKCGRFVICPNYCGSTRPQDYNVWDKKRGVRVSNMAQTISEAKEDVEAFMQSEGHSVVAAKPRKRV